MFCETKKKEGSQRQLLPCRCCCACTTYAPARPMKQHAALSEQNFAKALTCCGNRVHRRIEPGCCASHRRGNAKKSSIRPKHERTSGRRGTNISEKGWTKTRPPMPSSAQSPVQHTPGGTRATGLVLGLRRGAQQAVSGHQDSQIFVCHGLAVEVVEQELLPVLVAVDQQQSHAALRASIEDRLGYLLARCEDWRVDVQCAHVCVSILWMQSERREGGELE